MQKFRHTFTGICRLSCNTFNDSISCALPGLSLLEEEQGYNAKDTLLKMSKAVLYYRSNIKAMYVCFFPNLYLGGFRNYGSGL